MFNDYGPSSPTLASRSPVIIPIRSTMYAKSMAVPRLRGCLPDARSRNLAPGLCTPRQGHGHDNQTRYLSSHSGTATVALFLLRLRSRSSCSVIRIDSPHPLLQVSACVRRRRTAINPRRNAGVRTRDLPVPNGARCLLRHIPKAEKSASFFSFFKRAGFMITHSDANANPSACRLKPGHSSIVLQTEDTGSPGVFIGLGASGLPYVYRLLHHNGDDLPMPTSS